MNLAIKSATENSDVVEFYAGLASNVFPDNSFMNSYLIHLLAYTKSKPCHWYQTSQYWCNETQRLLQ